MSVFQDRPSDGDRGDAGAKSQQIITIEIEKRIAAMRFADCLQTLEECANGTARDALC